MTKHMCIKWLKWLQNCVVEGSEQYQALQFAIDYMENNEDGSVIDSEPTVTEQEIVKPYLAKLKSEIYEKIDSANTGWADCRVDDIIEIIDNLLGQEQTNDN